MQPPFMHEDWFDQWLYNVIHYPNNMYDREYRWCIRSFTRLYFYAGPSIRKYECTVDECNSYIIYLKHHNPELFV